ncbi:hypothetical protein J2X65_002025 [Ancylobacter sp. 3268]|uniref:PBECR2 nuclease fold domain-containing protein n=1 Tax=Ancylobacter sp. 3268 TaxID=2817752 RepID=UPI002857E2CC|nr:PBECR2 nuclease fold domain-containing protein [Ancylobacter sp. 3268]MDR6952666.1 hypothetical protein [Ancylobacter sp. 3268]
MTVALRILQSIRPANAASFARRRVARPAPRFAEGGFRLAMQEAIDFHRQKVRLPTRGYRDLAGNAHDRAFVVAGATRDALLAGLHGAVDAAIADGITLPQFRERFDDIVARHGWTGWTGEGTEAGRAWRARVIYETNLLTAHAAGRYKQMTHPDVVKVRPFWMYRHGDRRRPANPRVQHVAWNGLVLRWDHEFWKKHYPPNGWFCSCGVRPLSQRDLTRMGKDGPDTPPPAAMRRVRDPATGDSVEVPEGIEFGWDHAPGRDWAEGVVPRELQKPLDVLPPELPRSERAQAPAAPAGRAFTADSLAPGLPPEDYAQAFLKEFGADVGKSVAWRDAAGHVVPISEELFKTASGAWKVAKRGRDTEVLKLAETLKDPDEIWVNWARDADGALYLLRSYIRWAEAERGFVMFEWAARAWRGVTAFPPDRNTYLEKERRGALLWKNTVNSE